MQARTERFEMRLEQDVLDRIDTWRETRRTELERPVSRSEAVRTLLDLGLDRGPPTLSDGDRLTLMMLRDILKHLKIKGEIDPDFVTDAMWGGHFWALDWQYSGLFHSHRDKRSTVTQVVDILDMWSFVEGAFSKLSAKEQKRVQAEAGEQATFLGFDGNYESEYMSVAQFLIEKMGRFSNFKGRSLNSHCPVVDRYRSMVQVFEPIRKTLTGRKMNSAELIEVLKAQRR